MWLGSSFTFNPNIFLLGVPKTPKFWQGRGGGFLKPKILKQGCIDNRLIFFLFQKTHFQRQLNWNDRYFRIRERIPLTHARTHTHKKTQYTISIFLPIMGRTLGCSCLNLIPTLFGYVCCYVMHSQYINYIFDLSFNYLN